MAKRMTGNDYKKALDDVYDKKRTLAKAIQTRLRELVKANPNVPLPSSRAGGRTTSDIDNIWIIEDLLLETAIEYIRAIEKYLADKHPHKQTKIEGFN